MKDGEHGSFSTYARDFLTNHKLRRLPKNGLEGIVSIFYLVAPLVFTSFTEEMKGYLSIAADKRILQAVITDLNFDEYLAGCKALGCVSELIAIQLWAQIERTDTNIINIGVVYR
jgi:hypothetical protein